MKVPSELSSSSSGSFDDNEYIKSLLSNEYCLTYPDSLSLDTRSDTLMTNEDSNGSRRDDIQKEQIQNIVNTFENYEASNWKQHTPLSSLEETDKQLQELLHWTTEFKKDVKDSEEAHVPKKPKFSFVEQFKTHEEERKKSEKCLKANYETRVPEESIAALMKAFPQYGMSYLLHNDNVIEEPSFDIPEKISYPSTTSEQTRLDIQSWLNTQERIKSEPENNVCPRNKSSPSEDYYSELFDHLKLDNVNLFSSVPLESPSSTTSSLTVASPICSPNKTLPPMVPGTRKFDVENFGFVKHNFHRQPRQVSECSTVWNQLP